MTRILSSPLILRLSLPLLHHIANSSSLLLNPDRNPILHVVIRKLIYDHFNAGENEQEVRATVKQMKKLGFKGVILGYAKEVNVSNGAKGVEAARIASGDVDELAIWEWKEGTLKTLRMLGEYDFLAVK
jgi:proline dehydrogenase